MRAKNEFLRKHHWRRHSILQLASLKIIIDDNLFTAPICLFCLVVFSKQPQFFIDSKSYQSLAYCEKLDVLLSCAMRLTTWKWKTSIEWPFLGHDFASAQSVETKHHWHKNGAIDHLKHFQRIDSPRAKHLADGVFPEVFIVTVNTITNNRYKSSILKSMLDWFL